MVVSNHATKLSTIAVLITLGATLFLGEKLGVRRISGIAASMIGAMMIIRPGSEVFSVTAFPPGRRCVLFGLRLVDAPRWG